LSQSGVDALIAQDLGIVNIIKKYFPSLKLHASAQISIHNSYGLLEDQKAGFKRVILSRELSLQEIKIISNKTDIELEIFAHGALRFGVSGLCLMSSFIGGCSGNRGKCAQPCRRRWSFNNKSGFYMSPKDLDLSKHIKELKSLELTSLKIEGRIKNPQYVYSVVKAYKALLSSSDENSCRQAKENIKQDLARTKTNFNFIRKSEDIFTPDMPKQIGLYLGKIISVTNNSFTLKTNAALNVGDEIKIVDASKDISYKAIILNVKETLGNYEIATDFVFARQGMHVFKTSDIKTAKIIEYIFNKTSIEKQQFIIKENKISTPLFKDNQIAPKLFLKVDNPRRTPIIKDKNLSLIFLLDRSTIKNTELF
jgi:putative protease